MYIAFLKEGVAVAKTICDSIEEMQGQMTLYDECIEISQKDFEYIELPARLNNGAWEKTDEMPVVEYPQVETPTPPTAENPVYDELAAAYKEGVQEA